MRLRMHLKVRYEDSPTKKLPAEISAGSFFVGRIRDRDP